MSFIFFYFLAEITVRCSASALIAKQPRRSWGAIDADTRLRSAAAAFIIPTPWLVRSRIPPLPPKLALSFSFSAGDQRERGGHCAGANSKLDVAAGRNLQQELLRFLSPSFFCSFCLEHQGTVLRLQGIQYLHTLINQEK